MKTLVKAKKLLVLAFVTLACTGCTTYGLLEADPTDPSQEVGVDNGNPYILSSQKNKIAITVPQTFKANDRMRIFVRAINGEKEPLFFNPNYDMTAGVGETEASEKIHIYSEDELVDEISSGYGWSFFGKSLFGMMDVMTAHYNGYETTTGTYDGHYEGRVGNNYYGGEYSGTWEAKTYNPYKGEQATQKAIADNDARLGHLEAEYNNKLSAINSEILKPQTIPPNESCWGQLEVETPSLHFSDSGYLWFNVMANKETHTFRFRYTKQK